jgi:hypothetical protein
MGKIVGSPMKKLLGKADFGGIEFPIRHGRFETLDFVDKVVVQDVLLACAHVTHGKSGIAYDDAVRIVKSALQIEWYKHRGEMVPPKLAVNLENLIVEATTKPIEASGGGKRGTLKIMDVIVDGLLRHVDEAQIIRTVHEQFPEARTGPRDVAFYRHKLRKSGDLPAYERPTKTSRKETKMADAKTKEEAGQEPAAAEPKLVRTVDILKAAKDEGLSLEQLSTRLHEALDGRPADQKTIKDIIVPGIVDGKSTDDIVKEVHETFKDVPSVTPKTGPKDVAYYRTRLRKDYNLEIPTTRSTSTKNSEEVKPDVDAEATPTEAEPAAPVTRTRRAKNVAAAPTPAADEALAEQAAPNPTVAGIE